MPASPLTVGDHVLVRIVDALDHNTHGIGWHVGQERVDMAQPRHFAYLTGPRWLRLDRLLLLLSQSSVNSAWVDAEVQMALVRERTERRRVLFPVRIDDAVLTSGVAWAALVHGDYHIGDFGQWKAHDSYQQAFQRLLRDLKAEQWSDEEQRMANEEHLVILR